MSSTDTNQTAEAPMTQNSDSEDARGNSGTKAPLIAGLITGVSASACCAGPLILLTLGISGSWIGNLSKLEPYRPIFIGLALIFIALAFRKLYLLPKACTVDAPCATTAGERHQRIIFWIVSVIVLASIAFPWYGPWLLDD